MDRKRAIEHFLHYLPHHPAIGGRSPASILIGHTQAYANLVGHLIESSASSAGLVFQAMDLDDTPTERLAAAIVEADLYIFFYDASTLPNPRAEGPSFIRALQPVISEHWKKSLLFKDYGDFFYDTFSVAPARIADLNAALIDRMSQGEVLSFTDPHGSHFEASLRDMKKWTNINGVGNYDLAPGEIATHSETINGHVRFVGTFLGTIPFARKYGVLETPLEMWIENSTISRIATEVPGLEQDFNKYLDANPSNRRIEELGIGTNEGVKHLYARNAGFEERHCGLHLGLGGGAKGSHHLDLIFDSGTLAVDDQVVFSDRSGYLV
ncbi:leucyl aminopeptidase [Pseudomonas sp. RIT-PI-AD]|uniref:leucyl aminopeptidase n=1 Tax=Pseudomonas sp. RIT-PI-AD TaxID=3035294 RepID=UPI0021DB5808|nr:leucyl aminopeptidase [Pseudomonas sp. RIT-PI-AD]